MKNNFGVEQRKRFSQIGSLRIAFALMCALSLPVGFSVLGVLPAAAQNTNATIQGQIFDPSGALLPGAQVTIGNQETGVTVFKGKTDSSGAFVAPQVIPGTYRISASAPSLKQTVISNVQATVAQVTYLNIHLELGDVSETVTVQAKGESLDTSTSDVSTLITPSDVQNLPLQQRTTENLLAFIPGVSHGGAASAVNTSQLSISGSRTLDNEVLLNGVSVVVASTGTLISLPSPDGVDSFRVFTSNAPAEYGRTSGAIVSLNTRSGTNVYHGNAYFLLRNEDLDANTYFNKLTINAVTGAPLPRGRDRFFQAGGSLGGPVRFPHLYNGRDKTFFFVNYDRTIVPSTSVVTETVPTAAQRTGNFANALAPTDATGKARTVQQIYMPTGTASAAFSGGQIGPIDPAAASVIALLPLPNTVGTYDPVNNRYTGNWTSQQNLTSNTVKLVGRVDESITPANRLSFNVYRYTSTAPQPVDYNSALLNTTWDCSCISGWVASTEYTHIFSPSLVMDLNMGYFRYLSVRNPPGMVDNVSQTTGIASLPINQFPNLTVTGLSGIGSTTTTNQHNSTNTFVPFVTVTKTVGAHSIQFGGNFRRNQYNSFTPQSYPEGSFTFDGTITNHGSAGNANTGLADFLLGKVKTATYEQPQPETGRRGYNWALFGQDDWHATSKLTLNLGIRYEYESPLIVASNIYSRVDPATGQILAAGLNGVSPSLNISTPKANVSPRLGLAYSINDKTVLRAAYGNYYGTIFQNLGSGPAFPGFDQTITYNNLGTAVAQPFSLSQGLPLAAAPNLMNPFSALVGSSASNPYNVGGTSLFNNLSHLSMVEEWSLGIQRQLPLAITMELTYVGNHGLHLPYTLNENAVPLSMVPAVTLANTSLATQNSLPFPNLQSFSVTDNIGGSNYNSLQVVVRRNFSTRLAVVGNYAYSKAEDDGTFTQSFSSPTGATAFSQYHTDSPYFIKDVAPSSFDVKNVAKIAVIYTTGGPWWLRGFHISPVFLGNTGIPLNISQTAEIPGSSQRPNGNPQLIKLAQPYVTGASVQYFDSPATDPNFPLTPVGPIYSTINGVRTQIAPLAFGNVSRNSNRAPGQVEFDASVSKDVQLYRQLHFQIRVDAFNVINHTNLGYPSTSLTITSVGTLATFATSSSFGKITSANPPRQMQASARFFF